ncbi:MAG TPA: hypothetical protein VF135_08915 [Terriglobales bacterium]
MQSEATSEIPNSAISTSQGDTEPKAQQSVILSGVSVVSGIIQGACAILVASSSLKVLVGLAGLAAAMKSSELHAESVRIPLIGVASLTSVMTLFVVWNGWRLRNRASGNWRKRKLSLRSRLAIAFSLATALISLALVAGEIFVHPLFAHH